MIWKDLRISARSLFRSPVFAAMSILTLAVAIGLATSVFSIVNALLIRPLPYRNADRLAMIWSVWNNSVRSPVSFDDFEDWRRNSQTIERGMLFSAYYKPILTGAGEAQRLNALLVSHEYFAVLGVQPMLGRFFRPEEDRDGRDDVVVLSYSLWRDQFHADPGVVGRKIQLDARPHEIVGVAGADLPLLPPSLAHDPAQIYRPVGEPFNSGSRDGRHLEAMVLLQPGVSIDQAQAELNVRSRDIERAHPDADAHLNARIVKLRDDLTRNVRTGLLALQSAVLVLLLIACANIANLLLAKSSGRRREMAVRAALGANTRQITRLLLAESAVLGLAGGVCGLALAAWSTFALTAVAARVLPDAHQITIDPRVLGFSFGLSLMAAILFGLAPILHMDSIRLDDALKHGFRVAGDRRIRLRQLLAASQIALALVLLVSAGLLARSFLRLRGVNPGFDPSGVLAASISLPQGRYPNAAAAIQFFDRALGNLRAIPGVRQAAAVSVVPMSGDFDRTAFVIPGKSFEPGKQVNPDRYIVTTEYFQALHIPLRQGRLFEERDDASHPPVCIISETAARSWFGSESPLGQKVRAGSASGSFDNSPFREVVGVVGDVAQYGLGLPATPQIYMPHAQFARRFASFIVRTDGDPEALAPSLRKTVFAVDPEQPVYGVISLDQIVSNSIAARRLGLWLLAVFALGALTLASIGIYGVVSYSVSQRTSEFGIRMALGARPADILRGAIADSLPMIVAGLAGGIAGSLAISKLLASFLYGVRATDASTFAVLPLFLAMVALAACYVPARRAAKVDPLTALRYQ
ncbi:MAG TPA: ABC transporter permease [Bryobacteraceae bacterium]|nr:ABC transporter permease [Bryobacteraceae bacterium]